MRHAATLLALALAGTAFAAVAADRSVRWETTVKMKMTQPMAMDMPSFSNTECGPAEPLSEPPAMQDGECTLDEIRQSGDRVDYKVSCEMDHGRMSGEGWAEKVDADNYRGQMSIGGDAGGMTMAATMDYSSKRVGSCAAE